MNDSLTPGARVRITQYPMTMPGTYPIGRQGVVGESKGEGYFEVALEDGNLPFCDGKILVQGTEVVVLPVTSPCAPSEPVAARRGEGPTPMGALI